MQPSQVELDLHRAAWTPTPHRSPQDSVSSWFDRVRAAGLPDSSIPWLGSCDGSCGSCGGCGDGGDRGQSRGRTKYRVLDL